MSQNKELYDILGVDPSASDSTIREAYERLIAQAPEGTERNEQITRAYTILSDMDSRAAYDITGKVRKAPSRIHRSNQLNGTDRARYILNTLFLVGAAVTTVLFILNWSKAIPSTPFYWACGTSLVIKIAEYILRLVP